MSNKSDEILEIFQQISSIPRCSKHEELISKWLRNWANQHNLESGTDTVGNLLIKAPASKGFENAPTIVLQGHMDMVCVKESDSDHDFSKDAIELIFDGAWLTAKKTSLGADNGIAVAIGLTLLVDKCVAHPPLELLLTVDEESGIVGANNLDPEFISGSILLNLDEEKEGVFTIGCAGFSQTNISLPLTFERIPNNHLTYRIIVTGAQGGHSGLDIDKHRANANIVLARALNSAKHTFDIRLISMKGGTVINAISNHAEATFSGQPDTFPDLQALIREFEKTVQQEFSSTESSISITLIQAESSNQTMSRELTSKVLDFILALPHGVADMSADISNLVETSNNLAIIEMKDGHLDVLSTQRSSVTSKLSKITSKLEAVASLAGASVNSQTLFPPWQPNMNSKILQRCRNIYSGLFNQDPVVDVTHGGLECGVIGAKFNNMEMISFGPTIENPHTTNERLHVPSIGKVWDFLTVLLKSFEDGK